MKSFWTAVLLLILCPLAAQAAPPKPELKRIYFNLYTDSIKTVLNYYVNVEGEYSNGSYLPLDSSTIELSADNGKIIGNEWIAPKEIHFEKVTFKVVARCNPKLRDEVTVWLKRGRDPRDEPGYEEMQLPQSGIERKGKRPLDDWQR